MIIYCQRFGKFLSPKCKMEIKSIFMFAGILIVSCGGQNDGMSNEILRSVEPPAQRNSVEATMSTSVNTTMPLSTEKRYSTTSIIPPTEVTVPNINSECYDIATDFAYQNDLCAGAEDPESYLDLGKSRYTCLNRCGEAPEYGKRSFQCGCDASCEAYKDCCGDMAQVCPDLHNTEHAEYAQLLRDFTACHKHVSFYNNMHEPFSFSTKPYPAFTPAVRSKGKVPPFKPRTLKEFTSYLQNYKVVDTKRKFIFDNYNAYNAYKSNQSTPYFNPKVIDLTCEFVKSGSSRFHSVLKVMPWCRVSQVEDALTQYHRPCKKHQILICRCKDSQLLKDHVHNACLGKNYSMQSLYRYPLWDRQLKYSKVSLRRGQVCLRREVTKFSGRTLPINSPKQLDTTMKMRISPVLSRSRTPHGNFRQKEAKRNQTKNVYRESDIGYIVELSNTTERQFYCSNIHNRLEDCWLEECVEGGLIWVGNLSQGLPARRSCIFPVGAKILHGDGSSGVPLCTCLSVLAALYRLGIWGIRLTSNKDTGCLFNFTALPTGEFGFSFISLA